MNCIDFSGLTREVSITNIVGQEGVTVPKWTAWNRPDTQLYCNVTGSQDYFREDGSHLLTIHANEVLFCPYGSTYSCIVHEDEPNLGILVKFNLLDSFGQPLVMGGHPQVVAQDPDGYYRESMRDVVKQCFSGGYSLLRAKSLLFELLYSLANEQLKTKEDTLFRSILPAVRYLQNHLQEKCDNDLLAELCFVSRSTFQRRFRAYYNASPAEWHMRLRIEKSTELLRSGLYTVEQVADLMGFCDTAYFCRTFKKITGKYTRELKHINTL